MLELSAVEILEIQGGAPTKKTSFFYDVAYCVTFAVTWLLGQGDEMAAAAVRQDAKHAW